MRRTPQDIARSRRARAVAIAVALVVAAPGAEAVSRALEPPDEKVALEGGLNAAQLTGSGDADVVLRRLEDAADADGTDVPDVFVREIGFLPEARGIRANGDGSVVGYVVPFELEVSVDKLREHMLARGFTAVSLGRLEGATFVKQGGSYRWALATCTQVGTVTSIVIRSVVA